jgi:hypothetical protein
VTLSVPAPPGRAAGSRITGAIYQADVTDSVNFLANVPQFLGSQTSVQSIPNTTVTAILIDTEKSDTYDGHSLVTNTSRYTCQTNGAGWYLFVGSVLWAASNLGSRSVGISKNGVSQGSVSVDCSRLDVNPNLTATALVQLAVGDYVEVVAYQSTGSASSTAAGSYLAGFWVHA